MRPITKILLTSTFLTGSTIAFAGEPIGGSVTLTSDYIFRGISQTQEKPGMELAYFDTSLNQDSVWPSPAKRICVIPAQFSPFRRVSSSEKLGKYG